MARKTPYTDQIVAYVAAHPGCTKADVARHITHARHFSKSYALINTQVRLGHIRAVGRGGRYWLFLPGCKCYRDFSHFLQAGGQP
jgi:hypothetical protein